MSWLFSRVLVEEYLGENFSDGEQSAPLSGNPTPQAYLPSDKTIRFWNLSRYGMTCKPLTESRGEELLMSFRAGFRARTLAAQEKEQELDGERSSMWKHMARVVCEVRPEWVFVENSPMLVSRGLGTVLRDLAEIGFDAAWSVLSAADVGAPHLRERIWIVAHSGENGRLRGGLVPDLDRTQGAWRDTTKRGKDRNRFEILSRHRKALGKWLPEPEPDGMVDGVACQVERLAATGNGQVPRVAAAAFAILAEQLITANVRGNGLAPARSDE